jgi:hypothetical protein
MAETQKSDEDRLIDETLSLFRNAIAETKTILPPVQFGRAVEHVPPSEPPEKRAASLISHAVSIARTVAGFVPKAVQTASPSLQPPVAKQATEKPVGDVRSDPLVDQVLSMVPIIPIEPNMAETTSPPSLNTAEAEVLSLLQPVDKPASKAVLPLERPTQEEPPFLIDPAHSLVKEVVISEQKAVSVKEVAISEHKAVQITSPSLQPPVAKQATEKPVGNARSDPLVDQALSMVAMVPIDEPNVVEASPASLNMPETAVLSPRQTVDKPDLEYVLPLEQSTQEEPPSLIDQSTLVEPTALKTEAPVPLPQQPLMIQLSPKERLDMDRAEIRKRVVAFRHHQQRFQRDREEYYATTISKARTILGKAET